MRTNNKQEVSASTQRRMTVVYLLTILLGLACLVKILYLSIAERAIASGTSDKCVDTTKDGWEDLETDDTYCYVKENTLRPVRGEIYDENGRVLVANFTVFEVAFDGKGFAKEYADTLKKNPKAYDEIFRLLADDFYAQFKDRYPKYDADYYYNFFTHNIQKKHYATLFFVKEWDDRTWVTGVDTAFVKNRPYLYKQVVSEKSGDSIRRRVVHTHFNFVPANVRVNPYGEMAKRTLGAETSAHQYGLEHSMNDILAGVEGSKKYLELNHAKVPLRDRLDPSDGYNIHTTIKLEVQHAVHNELQRKLSELGAEWGCAIVMETKTGEIKAISNLRRASADASYYNESMEYALNAKVEPGSTFKLASLLAYLEKTPDDTVGRYTIYDYTFDFPTKSGKVKRYRKVDHAYTPVDVSALEVFKRSSNVGIAQMVFEKYGKRGFNNYLAQLKKFGLLLWRRLQHPDHPHARLLQRHRQRRQDDGAAVRALRHEHLRHHPALRAGSADGLHRLGLHGEKGPLLPGAGGVGTGRHCLPLPRRELHVRRQDGHPRHLGRTDALLSQGHQRGVVLRLLPDGPPPVHRHRLYLRRSADERRGGGRLRPYRPQHHEQLELQRDSQGLRLAVHPARPYRPHPEEILQHAAQRSGL